MSKEYEINNEEQQMASEPVMDIPKVNYIYGSLYNEKKSDMSSAISGEELKKRLHKGLKTLFV